MFRVRFDVSEFCWLVDLLTCWLLVLLVLLVLTVFDALVPHLHHHVLCVDALYWCLICMPDMYAL